MTDERGRVDRQEAERTERRRRDDATIDGGQALKLGVPPEVAERLTAQGRTWRWANDVGDRITHLTKRDDWDKVEGVPARTVVIDKAKGTTCKAYLLSKPKDFMDQDRRKKDAGRREVERAMLRGQVSGAGGTPVPRPDNIYVPDGNKIERGNQII